MGVLFLRARARARVRRHELSLYRTIANATAIALRNARILQTLRDQTQQITFARFEAERRLRTLQRYADFFESAADGIVVIDSEGKLLFSNPRAREITGHGEADLIGKKLGDLFAEEERERAQTIRLGFHQGIYPQGIDIRIKPQRRRRRLAQREHQLRAPRRERHPLHVPRRHPRARHRGRAQTDQGFLERVIDSSVDAIVAADMRGRVLLFNRAAERCYGYSADEVVGKMNVPSSYPPGVAREVMRLIKSEMFGGVGRLEDYRCDMLRQRGRARSGLALRGAHLRRRQAGRVGRTLHRPARAPADARALGRSPARAPHAREAGHHRRARRRGRPRAESAAHERDGLRRASKRRLERDTPAFSAAHVIVNEAERMAEIVRKIGKITKYETKSYVGAARSSISTRPAKKPNRQSHHPRRGDREAPRPRPRALPRRAASQHQLADRQPLRRGLAYQLSRSSRPPVARFPSCSESVRSLSTAGPRRSRAISSTRSARSSRGSRSGCRGTSDRKRPATSAHSARQGHDRSIALATGPALSRRSRMSGRST